MTSVLCWWYTHRNVRVQAKRKFLSGENGKVLVNDFWRMSVTTITNRRPQAFSLDRKFFSAEECTELWEILGCGYRWVQLSEGSLIGRLRVDRQGPIILVSMQANQAMLVQGDRNPDWIPFTIEHTDNFSEHRHFGERVIPNALGGFNTSLKETMLRTSPGGNHIGAVLIDRKRVYELATLESGAGMLDRLAAHNVAVLGSSSHRRLRQLMDPPSWSEDDAPGSFHADFLEAHLFECLSPDCEVDLRPLRDTHRSELVHELVQYSFQVSTAPMPLGDVCRALFTTKTTLNVSCREMFGFGPMMLMKRVRLQQVHHVLRNPDLQRQLGCSAVQDVAQHFGFHSRNHFASDYRSMFSESPRETLVAARNG